MTLSKIEINMLPVNEGDCLHIRFQSNSTWHNIVIDSGPASCAFQFQSLIEHIRKQNEDVDLLCFSHIDDDHIKGAELTFSAPAFDSSHIKQIWMNLPDTIVSTCKKRKVSSYQNITVESSCKLFSLILAHNIPCKTKVIEGDSFDISNTAITAILPTTERLQSYYCSYEKDLEKVRQKYPHFPIGGRREDRNPYNGSSISLMMNTKYGKILFCGDAFASDLTKASINHADNDGFILVKLPHHGSDRNINEKLLKAFKCQNFLISTHSTIQRPAQNTINLLADYGKVYGDVSLYGNYEWPFIQTPNQGITITKLPNSNSPINIGNIKLFSEE